MLQYLILLWYHTKGKLQLFTPIPEIITAKHIGHTKNWKLIFDPLKRQNKQGTHISHSPFFVCRYTVVGKALIYYIIPLVVIGALYLLMAHRLRKSAREITSEIAGPQSRNQARARRYVARMVVAFVVGKYLFRSFAFIIIFMSIRRRIDIFSITFFQYSSLAFSHITYFSCGST